MGKAIRTALLGYGFGGSVFHAPLIQAVEGLELVVVHTSREASVKERWPHVKVTSDVTDIWRDPEITLVVISTPNHTHADYIQQAIDAGKHVVVDKPFVVDFADGERLIRLAKERGVLLSVYQNRRWDGDFRTVRDLITSGKLGAIRYYEAHYDRFRPQAKPRWKEQSAFGGGTLYDLGAHLIDQALVLFGRPETVTADCRMQRDNAEGTDYFHLILGYGALRVQLQSGSFVRKKGAKFIVHGTKASYMKCGEDPQERALLAGASPYEHGYGEEASVAFGTLHVGEEDEGERVGTLPGCYHRFYEQLRDAIRGEGEVPVRAEDALDVIRVIALAERSSSEGRTVRFEAGEESKQ